MNKNPLSLLIFYRRNFVKLSPFLLISLFSVFSVITLTATFDSWKDTAIFYQSTWKTSAIISYDPNVPNPLSLIKKVPNVKEVYPLDLYNPWGYIRIKLLGGYAGARIIQVKEENLKPLMDYWEVKLKQGRLPKENSNEITVSEQIVKNKRWKLNKIIREEIFGEISGQEGLRIVGILTGKTSTGFFTTRGTRAQNLETSRRKSYWKNYILIYKNKDKYIENAKAIEKMEKDYERKFKYYINIDCWNENWDKQIRDIQKDINFMSNISLITSIVVFCLIAIFLNIVYFQDRIGEYGLLLSLGLNKYQIIKKSFWESFSGILISWILGLLTANIFLNLLSIFIFVPRAWVLNTFPLKALPQTLPIPLGMLICGLLVVIYKIKKLDPVEIIERRW